DAALGTYNKTLSANEVTSIVSSNASSVYNFINAGTLSNKADSVVVAKDSSAPAQNNILTAFTQSKAKGTLNLEGTSIGSDGLDLTQNASALNLNAIFDNRGVDTSI
ncbi:hypothetical protein, partial [Helicobacter sp. 12S02232-10]|uniref:hypothetical protein n=1 Tax=Helicobacter sp. 12S02232-10 TaxID=1476197 RepID=UPI0015DE92C2